MFLAKLGNSTVCLKFIVLLYCTESIGSVSFVTNIIFARLFHKEYLTCKAGLSTAAIIGGLSDPLCVCEYVICVHIAVLENRALA